jgi:ABC-type Fe3+-hydroxamate transport system substrate-binding protein
MPCLSFPDQIGNTIFLPRLPQRIISLVPSQTELLADLGLDLEVVGITKFCIHPEDWHSKKTIVGGTKNFNLQTIGQLNPDLIIGNKEENYKEGIERLREKYPVWMSDIVCLADALAMIQSIGIMTNKVSESQKITDSIVNRFNRLKKQSLQSVLYLIWKQPWMGVGSGTFIHSVLNHLGLKNSLESTARYPKLTENDIRGLNPHYIFLSTEPYPFKAHHATELQRISPESKVVVVDGEMFSWYGSRLIKAADYFNTLALD